MDYFVPASLMTLLLLSQLLWLKVLQLVMKENRRREDSWMLEKERLLNRASSKDWQTFTQLQGSMAVSGSSDPTNHPDGPVGLGSDEVELERSGYPIPEHLDFDLSTLMGGDDGGPHAEPTIGADG